MMTLRVYYFLANLAVLTSYEIDAWNLGIITMWRGGLCKEGGLLIGDHEVGQYA